MRSPSSHRCATWRMSSCAVAAPVRGSMATASRWNFLASERIPVGSVAEKSSVRRSVGVAVSSVSSASRKPRSSISSASSRTSTSIADRSSAPRSTRSTSRPGVPTTTSTPCSQRAHVAAHVGAAGAGDDAPAGVARTARRARAALARQLARRRDDERARLFGARQLVGAGEEHAADDEAEGDGLARAGLRRDQQIGVGGLEHARLHRRRILVVALAQRLGERRRSAERGEVDVSHGVLIARRLVGRAETRYDETCADSLG